MDFYAVLGVKKESSAADLKNAYRRLAMRWHPDRCSSLGNMKQVEEAKKKFQAIQQAYSVLSDDNKRLLYDVGLYNNDDDDDENGMGDFLSEMADMMSQNKSSNENGSESLADLKHLFAEMFQTDLDAFSSSSSTSSSCSETSNATHKRNSSQMNASKSHGINSTTPAFDVRFQGFCLGMGGTDRRRGTNSRKSRK